ncbi:MAG: glutamine synthetase, partial [Planctomycetes bacterium]|nr:glutamine synthetase [Planctomycetota bacterium]
MDRIHNSSVPNGGSGKPLTPADFFKYAEQIGAEMVDLKFTDLLGTWQHCTFALDEWDESAFVTGVGFDGSSIRGWQDIHVSDMIAVPDPTTVRLEPFFDEPTLSVIADIQHP